MTCDPDLGHELMRMSRLRDERRHDADGGAVRGHGRIHRAGRHARPARELGAAEHRRDGQDRCDAARAPRHGQASPSSCARRCASTSTTPRSCVGATSNSITFYADFTPGDVTDAPHKRTVTFDPVTGAIPRPSSARRRRPAVAGRLPHDPEYGGPRVRERRPAEDRVGSRRAVPHVLRLQTVGTPRTLSRPSCSPRRSTPPRRRRASRGSTSRSPRCRRVPRPCKDAVNMSDQITVRHSDPNLTVPDPPCV